MIKKINDTITGQRAAVVESENDKGFNQRQSAWDSAVKADLSNAAIAAASYATANNGSYTNLALTGANSLTVTYGLTTSPNVLLTLGTVTGTSYIITGYNSSGGMTSTGGHTYKLTTGTITGPS
jgi:hypothetical protein